jgi:hypothetical protein
LISRWLKEKTPVAEEAVQEVNVVAKEVEPGTLHAESAIVGR